MGVLDSTPPTLGLVLSGDCSLFEVQNLIPVQVSVIDFYTYKAFGMGLRSLGTTYTSFRGTFMWTVVRYDPLRRRSAGMISRDTGRFVRSPEVRIDWYDLPWCGVHPPAALR